MTARRSCVAVRMRKKEIVGGIVNDDIGFCLPKRESKIDIRIKVFKVYGPNPSLPPKDPPVWTPCHMSRNIPWVLKKPHRLNLCTSAPDSH